MKSVHVESGQRDTASLPSCNCVSARKYLSKISTIAVTTPQFSSKAGCSSASYPRVEPSDLAPRTLLQRPFAFLSTSRRMSQCSTTSSEQCHSLEASLGPDLISVSSSGHNCRLRRFVWLKTEIPTVITSLQRGSSRPKRSPVQRVSQPSSPAGAAFSVPLIRPAPSSSSSASIPSMRAAAAACSSVRPVKSSRLLGSCTPPTQRQSVSCIAMPSGTLVTIPRMRREAQNM